MGEEVKVEGGGATNLIIESFKEFSQEESFRKSVASEPLFERTNTGNNLLPIIHWDILPGDSIKIYFLPKGALLVRASKITDGMAIAAARSLAEYAEKRGITPENIFPKMTETDVFPLEALAVVRKAIEEGVARKIITDEEIFGKAESDIKKAIETYKLLSEQNMIPQPDM